MDKKGSWERDSLQELYGAVASIAGVIGATVLALWIVSLYQENTALKTQVKILEDDQQRFSSAVQVLETEVQKWRKAAEPAFGARGISRMNPTPADLERALNPCIPMPGVTRPELCSKLDMRWPVPIRIGLNEELVRYVLTR